MTVSNLQLLSYGNYTEAQQAALKKRNPDLVGHIRHYHDITAHSIKQHTIRSYIANRSAEKALKKEYYQQIDGSPWGWEGIDLEVINLAFRLSDQRTDFPIGAAPPGYHLPSWKVEKNPDFIRIEGRTDTSEY